MTCTDAALAWLLSLPATCSSSPSSPFTDWLQISPSSSPTRPSSPLQDVSSSSRVNTPQEFYNHDIFNQAILQTSDTASLVQDRMFSLDSSGTTLVNSPSPGSLAFLDPPRHLPHTVSLQCSPPPPSNPSLFSSPPNLLTNSPFGSYLNFYDPVAIPSTALPPLTFSDVSPVVRASRKSEEHLQVDTENDSTKIRKKKSKPRDSRKPSSSFLEKLQSAAKNPAPTIQRFASSPRPLMQMPAHLPSDLPLVRDSSAGHSVLLSPVKLQNPPVASPGIAGPMPSPEPCLPALEFTTPPRPPTIINAPLLSLSPLTPLSSPVQRESSPLPGLKIKIVLKRKHTDADPCSPIKKTKRPRRTRAVAADLPSRVEQQNNDAPFTSENRAEPPEDENHENPRSVYTERTLPPNIERSEAFPLLYRRFPASTYYQPQDAETPCALFGLPHPGGNYNPPRRVFDLYTPRFVKGKGAEKVGLCPICVEPVSRGGENKRLWLAMKFSAFKCYHMQYSHGISASTGKPFSPPTAFRIVPRQNPGKNEKHHIQQGKCHKCSKWVVVEGVKDMESKVPELYWWKHAASCHNDSTLEGEGDYFEQDDVHAKLVTFELPDA